MYLHSIQLHRNRNTCQQTFLFTVIVSIQPQPQQTTYQKVWKTCFMYHHLILIWVVILYPLFNEQNAPIAAANAEAGRAYVKWWQKFAKLLHP